ncbi:methyltransferase domain-containing protein [Streptomyces marispadix]|uniref:Protein-L-isoaspartate O-methyltransferase n=1 Tax=Streptomyces marispadix TaxID=2922868 RepID=A0ABS9T032_9ACTN|nr:methyltransferase domain-containing protein [Streptomyces marispadix]MCH6161891.1 methyltransferase domain-containing protein [Streptomyces marispadix]
MTSALEQEGRPTRAELGRSLLDMNALSSDWLPSFEAVPRSAFLPDVMWPYDMETGRTVTVDKAVDPDSWERFVNSNVPVVTQWDDGRHTGREPGRRSTSSASMPSVVFSMLRDLDVQPGQRVLEIGTGTGYSAALLAHRLGAGNVVTMDVDHAVAKAARAALEQAGLPVQVVAGDGYAGHPEGAPYDRVIATCGLRHIPASWAAQTRPGGVIVAPWGTHYTHGDAVAKLTVAGDGTASGHFTRGVEFMKLRAQRLPFAGHDAYVPKDVTDNGDESKTTLTESSFAVEPYHPAPFALGLRVPDCWHGAAEKRDGMRPVWFYGLADSSWAVVIFRDGRSESKVYQAGPRRLWDEVEAAYRWWREQGEPGYERFGLTVTQGEQHVWLDTPDHEVASG